MTKQDKIEAFDPNGPSNSDQLFGLPFNYGESETVVIPIPWEVTVSYSSGTAKAPQAIKEASHQVDLFDPFLKDAWQHGIYMSEISQSLWNQSNALRVKAEQYIDALGQGSADTLSHYLMEINHSCAAMVEKVQVRCLDALNNGKSVVLLGGDHSTPLGLIKALGYHTGSFGILQIDAHADLRAAYEGFEYSHASIMYNALKEDHVSRLVQVGIRDYCDEEYHRIQDSNGRIVTFFDRDLKAGQYQGQTWAQQCESIIHQLPEKVYVSFDIDGLDPKLCPNTGTPVAGGFEIEETLFLLERIVESGREIIGLDLSEVSPGNNDWDANVGARLLYRLCNIMTASTQKKEHESTVGYQRA